VPVHTRAFRARGGMSAARRAARIVIEARGGRLERAEVAGHTSDTGWVRPGGEPGGFRARSGPGWTGPDPPSVRGRVNVMAAGRGRLFRESQRPAAAGGNLRTETHRAGSGGRVRPGNRRPRWPGLVRACVRERDGRSSCASSAASSAERRVGVSVRADRT
jgi:hypothetical protein